ncbi:MAG: hypothetical protein ACXACR_09985, partial [Candidatus Hodarchaeales archaeon]
MLRNVVEDYLISIKETQLFLPFYQLLELKGFYDIHLVHSTTEFGKDFIAKKQIEGTETQFSFQLKAGDINLSKFRKEVQPQFLEACTNQLSHPNFSKTINYQVIFVTSGNLQQPASIAFQEFNEFITSKLNMSPILTWEKEQLIKDFIEVGIEPFFSIHKSPDLIGKFFNFYAHIQNNKSLTYLDIEEYTEYWLDLDWQISENKLQVFFESYFFTKLLYLNENYYEAVLMLASMVRVLLKNNQYDEYESIILDYVLEIVNKYSEKVIKVKNGNKSLFNQL